MSIPFKKNYGNMYERELFTGMSVNGSTPVRGFVLALSMRGS
jgi:hypothetical protein